MSCNREGSLNKSFSQESNAENFHTNWFKRWNESNFKRWLLWLWCKLQNSNSYAVQCALKSDSLEDFPAQIYTLIFNFVGNKNFDEIYNERKEILRLMKIPLPENFVDKVKQSDKKISLKILTDFSAQERNLIFETLKKFSYADYDKVLKALKKVYPALANYLSTIEISDVNKGRDIYALKPRNQIVAEEYSNESAIYFVDAMGAEYLGYLMQIFDAGGFSVNYQVGYCALPTTTEFNKDFLADKNIVAETVEFDEMKHSNATYPENIVNELNFLATLKEKILTALDKFQKIILCADHGTSRLAVISRKSKFDKTHISDGRKVHNCGRFVGKY